MFTDVIGCWREIKHIAVFLEEQFPYKNYDFSLQSLSYSSQHLNCPTCLFIIPGLQMGGRCQNFQIWHVI